MLSTSYEYSRKVAQNSKVLLKATLTLSDGTTVQLAGDDFMMGTASFSEGVSSDGSFDIGAAVMGTFSVQLNNYDGRFDAYDFTESTIAPYIGVELDAGGVEWLARGRYAVDQPRTYGTVIAITAVDNMHLLERPYSAVGTTYPASLQTIVRDACLHCGVVQLYTSFPNDAYIVSERPDDKALSCRDVVAYAVQAAGCFARFDALGRLVIGWYDLTAFEDGLDGGAFDDGSPYATGDAADGGNFDDYTSGDVVNGGSFEPRRFAVIHAISSAAIVTDDVVVTGVRVTASDEKKADGSLGREGESSLYGTEGYVLSIEGNPFVQYGRASAVASQVGSRIAGMRFRPLDLSAVGDPAIEAGDPAVVVDAMQNQYNTFITSLTYKVGAYESFSCSAETPGRNTAASYSEATKAIVQMRNAVRSEVTARDLAVSELARQLAESSGLFMTTVPQQDGSTIYYMHDKPTLAESQIVWKLTANAFGISTDGGETYPYGLDVTGNAILNRIYAIGIDGQYITLGNDPLGDVVDDARKVATDYITDGTSGTDFAAPTGNAKMRILPTGMEIFDGNGDSALYAGLSGGNSTVRVGKASGSGNVVMSSEGYVDVRNASTVMAHFGYGDGTDSGGGTSEAPYYTLGVRKSGMAVGNYSVAEGNDSTASGFISHAEGRNSTASGFISHAEGEKTTASGQWSHAEGLYTTASSNYSHAEGWNTTASNHGSHAEGTGSTASGSDSHAEGTHTTASNDGSHAEGLYTTASGQGSHAEGEHTKASGSTQHVQGKYNIPSTSLAHIVGWGTSSSQKNIEYLSSSGNLWIAGALTQNSDRRLKEHHAYLGDDACDFVRNLKPALYTKDGERHVGFYAQDVRDAEPEGWDTVTVTEEHTDESLDFDPLTLEYTALIAPLVAYAQSLERKLEEQRRRIGALEARLKAAGL